MVVDGPHDSAAEVEASVQAAFEYYASSNIDLHQNVLDVKTVRVSQDSGKAKDEGKKTHVFNCNFFIVKINLFLAVCSALETMVAGGKAPDLVLETGCGPYTMAFPSLAAKLGIPVVTFGPRTLWEGLNLEQRQHIVQISTPVDVIAQVARVLIEEQQIPNAAILYDDSFSK